MTEAVDMLVNDILIRPWCGCRLSHLRILCMPTIFTIIIVVIHKHKQQGPAGPFYPVLSLSWLVVVDLVGRLGAPVPLTRCWTMTMARLVPNVMVIVVIHSPSQSRYKRHVPGDDRIRRRIIANNRESHHCVFCRYCSICACNDGRVAVEGFGTIGS